MSTNEPPSFEDSVTLAMHAVADGITRSIDLFLIEEWKALLQLLLPKSLRRAPVSYDPGSGTT
jgi:hypothetical protein